MTHLLHFSETVQSATTVYVQKPPQVPRDQHSHVRFAEVETFILFFIFWLINKKSRFRRMANNKNSGPPIGSA